MNRNGIKTKLGPFRALVLAILFTLSGLNCQAAANQCSELFADRSSPWIENLAKASPDAQKFWRDTGKQFQTTLQKDLDNNAFLYKRAMDAKHPLIAFLFKLGFQYKSERFIVPDFFFLMKNLDYYRQTSDQPMELRLLWTLKHKQYGLEQSMSLEPFQDFPANNMAYDIKTSLLPNEAFGKMIANGVFPIGGLEAASGNPRQYAEQSTGFYYMLSDFLHDLSHVQSLIENPAFSRAHQNVYKARETRWSLLEEKIGKVKMQNYRKMDEGTMAMFIFSESSWGFHPQYKSYVETSSLVKNLLNNEERITGETLSNLSADELVILKSELKSIEKNWWKIVAIYGGAAGDLITYSRFDAKYQLPMNLVHDSLARANNTDRNWSLRNFNDAALTLRFLKEAPQFTPTSWQYFALTKDVKNSKVFNSLKKIFEDHDGSQMEGFPSFAHFLGIKDTTKF